MTGTRLTIRLAVAAKDVRRAHSPQPHCSAAQEVSMLTRAHTIITVVVGVSS
jgi:hypothetical protein